MNVIYRGPLDRAPKTQNMPVTGALLPGTAVQNTGTALAQITAAAGNNWLILSNLAFKDQDVLTAYTSGDTGVAYEPRQGDEFAVAMAGATYAKNDELTIGANGRFEAAASGELVVAFFDGTPGAVSAGALADVKIANAYIKA
ncbi:MAG: hypothetical protein AAFP81_00860 [Pseudomonadota bacterium]